MACAAAVAGWAAVPQFATHPRRSAVWVVPYVGCVRAELLAAEGRVRILLGWWRIQRWVVHPVHNRACGPLTNSVCYCTEWGDMKRSAFTTRERATAPNVFADGEVTPRKCGRLPSSSRA